MRELAEPLRLALAHGQRCAWCTVVEARGSTPQKAGAAMLVVEDGRQFGTLGGGCVEAEVRRRALVALDSRAAALVDCTLDDDANFADGLICGGRMRFVVQPLGVGDSNAYFAALVALVESGEGGCEVVELSGEGSRDGFGRSLFSATGDTIAALAANEDAINRFRKAAPDLFARPKPNVVNTLAVLPLLPRCRLTVVGAGHVGQAVAELADKVDFDVRVIDDRESFANRARFPTASEILVGEFSALLKPMELGPRDYCLIVTRGHGHDAEALNCVVGKPARYLGLIGSRRKIRTIFEDLERSGVERAALAKVHAPIGLAIGSQTVMEIALSIVAQLVGHRNIGPAQFPPQDHFARSTG